MEFIQEWVGVIAAMLSLGAMFYTWLTSRAAKNSERLDKVEAKLSAQHDLVLKIENELEHLPDKDAVNELNLEITRLVGAVSTLNEKVMGMDRAVSRMDKYLRSQ